MYVLLYFLTHPFLNRWYCLDRLQGYAVTSIYELLPMLRRLILWNTKFLYSIWVSKSQILKYFWFDVTVSKLWAINPKFVRFRKGTRSRRSKEKYVIIGRNAIDMPILYKVANYKTGLRVPGAYYGTQFVLSGHIKTSTK